MTADRWGVLVGALVLGALIVWYFWVSGDRT